MRKKFEKLWQQLGAENDPEPEFQFLYDSYTQPSRYYHNLTHVQACLKDLRDASSLTNTPELVEFAIWYHDVVYDVNRSDNEQKSAEVASAVCSRAKLSSEAAQEIYDLILVTKHHNATDSINQKIIIDVDLAILGKPADEYDIYEKAIRKEYSHVTEDDFRKGRAAILRSFLEKPSIYSLEFFNNKYQKQAIVNIQKAILELT
jgi:predicted metal-dependent HD superfamily phosphohydrolase